MKSFLLYVLTTLLLSILKVVCLLVAIAYFTLAERKIMAAVQRRVGPNVVGPFGLLQPLADGLKLAGKELAIPAQASSRIFLSVAITVLLFALSGWSAIPFGMFDHSEYMSNSSVAKTLVLTEPGFDMYRTALDLCFVSPESRGFLRFWSSFEDFIRQYGHPFVLDGSLDLVPAMAVAKDPEALLDAALEALQPPYDRATMALFRDTVARWVTEVQKANCTWTPDELSEYELALERNNGEWVSLVINDWATRNGNTL